MKKDELKLVFASALSIKGRAVAFSVSGRRRKEYQQLME
jgi:hypothetical protein